jgi:glucose/arabinose dehydrogenase
VRSIGARGLVATVITAFVAAILASSAAVAPAGAGGPSPFPDVNPGDAFYDDILWMVDRGVTAGFDDGTFRPLEGVSRQGMAAFLYRLAGEPPGPFDDPGFSDVSSGDPFYAEISWLAHTGITTGFSDGTFRPADTIDRQAMAAFLHRLAGVPPPNFPDPGFSDVGPLHPFYEEIAWMKAAGVTTGFGDGTFRSQDPVTRQSMSAFLRRLKTSSPLVTVIADGLKAPWDVAFVPGGLAYFTERDTGLLKRVDASGHVTTIRSFDIDDGWETGLLGLEPSPDFTTDGLLYAFVSTDADNRVVTFDPTTPAVPETPIITGLPIFDIHDGGRIHFGPDGNLWVTMGDVGNGNRAANPADVAGKVLRYTPDGDPAPGNPTSGSPVYTRGHRNVQGLAWHPSGKLFASELGPDVNDEVHVLVAGGNYGWDDFSGVVNQPGLIDPLITRDPPQLSPSGAAIVPATPNNDWAGDLVVAGMRGRRILRANLDGAGNVTATSNHFVGWFGRIRHVEPAPDGSLWLFTTNAEEPVGSPPQPAVDRILRVIPPG